MSTVQDIEDHLFEVFGHTQDSWDNCGIVCGDPAKRVRKVLVALDQTVGSVEYAAKHGCDAIVSHHPAFIQAPRHIVPSGRYADGASRTVYEAVRSGVALIAMHTNLDKSRQALDLAARLFGLEIIDRLDDYGCILDGGGMDVERFAEITARAFSCEPAVWDAGRPLWRIAWCSGSAGSLAEVARERDCDMLIGGEMGYHTHLDLLAAGVSSMVIGHDKSELPYVDLLRETLAERFETVEYETHGRDVCWRRVGA